MSSYVSRISISPSKREHLIKHIDDVAFGIGVLMLSYRLIPDNQHVPAKLAERLRRLQALMAAYSDSKQSTQKGLPARISPSRLMRTIDNQSGALLSHFCKLQRSSGESIKDLINTEDTERPTLSKIGFSIVRIRSDHKPAHLAVNFNGKAIADTRASPQTKHQVIRLQESHQSYIHTRVYTPKKKVYSRKFRRKIGVYSAAGSFLSNKNYLRKIKSALLKDCTSALSSAQKFENFVDLYSLYDFLSLRNEAYLRRLQKKGLRDFFKPGPVEVTSSLPFRTVKPEDRSRFGLPYRNLEHDESWAEVNAGSTNIKGKGMFFGGILYEGQRWFTVGEFYRISIKKGARSQSAHFRCVEYGSFQIPAGMPIDQALDAFRTQIRSIAEALKTIRGKNPTWREIADNISNVDTKDLCASFAFKPPFTVEIIFKSKRKEIVFPIRFEADYSIDLASIFCILIASGPSAKIG